MNEKLKFLLFDKFGNFGLYFYFVWTSVFAVAYVVLPFFVFDFHFLIICAMIIAGYLIPFADLGVWIWGLVRVINAPQNAVSTMYYISFVALFCLNFLATALYTYKIQKDPLLRNVPSEIINECRALKAKGGWNYRFEMVSYITDAIDSDIITQEEGEQVLRMFGWE